MTYKSLEKLFYMDRSTDRYASNEKMAQERLHSEYTFRTGMQTPAGELFLAAPHELLIMGEQALRLERKVSKALDLLPPVARGALVRSLVIDEVVSTNELEGVRSTRRQINDALESLGNDEAQSSVRIRRFRELAMLYLGLSDKELFFPSNPEDIRAVYDRVMAGEDLGDNAPDGRLFRRGEVGIYAADGELLHEGLYPESAITAAIQQMIDLAESDAIPQMYSAIVSHYIFEYIHPFYNGNGRTGRYLLALYLSRPLSTLTSLSLSRVIAENREAYYREFKRAEKKLNHGELTFFVMNILQDIQIAQSKIVANLEQKHAQLVQAEARVQQVGIDLELPAKERAILFLLAQLQLFATFPNASLVEVADYTGVGTQQARKYTIPLEERGLITVERKRSLRFGLSAAGCAALGLQATDAEAGAR